MVPLVFQIIVDIAFTAALFELAAPGTGLTGSPRQHRGSSSCGYASNIKSQCHMTHHSDPSLLCRRRRRRAALGFAAAACFPGLCTTRPHYIALVPYRVQQCPSSRSSSVIVLEAARSKSPPRSSPGRCSHAADTGPDCAFVVASSWRLAASKEQHAAEAAATAALANARAHVCDSHHTAPRTLCRGAASSRRGAWRQLSPALSPLLFHRPQRNDHA